MFCKLVVLLACLSGAALAEKTPVFLWGTNSPSKPTLYTISEDEFADLLKPKAKDTMFVVFQEPELSCSDFTCSKSSSKDSCFSNLKGVAPRSYYSSVVNPIESIRKISASRESAIVDVDGNLDHDVTCQPGTALFLDLGVLSEGTTNAFSRDELLEMHDEVISKAYNKLSEDCKITAVYTRTPSTSNAVSSKSRRRRALDKPTSGTMFRSGRDFLLFYTELMIQDLDEKQKPVNTPVTIAGMSLSGQNDTAFTVNLDGGSNTMNFLISLAGGYFKMSALMLNKEAYYVPSEVVSPTDFSYSCGNQTFFSTNSTRKIIWNSLQMQAPFNNATPSNFTFGDSWYCVGFFSSGILAGLFVVFILLGIISVGICWMLDINTMDRFDDPKGKTITINVNE